jgi:hypothetical protein
MTSSQDSFPEHVEMLMAALVAALALRGEIDRRETVDLADALRTVAQQGQFHVLGMATVVALGRQLRNEIVLMGATPTVRADRLQ